MVTLPNLTQLNYPNTSLTIPHHLPSINLTPSQYHPINTLTSPWYYKTPTQFTLVPPQCYPNIAPQHNPSYSLDTHKPYPSITLAPLQSLPRHTLVPPYTHSSATLVSPQHHPSPSLDTPQYYPSITLAPKAISRFCPFFFLPSSFLPFYLLLERGYARLGRVKKQKLKSKVQGKGKVLHHVFVV